VWGVIWTIVVSELWKHKNKVIFKGGIVDALEMFALVQLRAWSWVTTKPHSGYFFFSDWCLDPLLCMRMVL